MVLVNVESLVIGLLPMPSVITLRVAEHREDIADDLVLPIWIGTMEATAIAAALEGNATERPITLAARANAPLFVEEDVMQSAACPRALTPGQDEQIELEEFDKFIEHIKPEDFVTHNGGKD